MNWFRRKQQNHQSKVCVELFTAEITDKLQQSNLVLTPVTSSINDQLVIYQSAISYVKDDMRDILDYLTIFTETNDKSIQVKMQSYIANHYLKGALCEVILPSDFYKILLLPKPVVADHELNDAMKWKVKDLVALPVEDIAIDYFDFPTEGKGIDTAMVYVVVASKSLIQQLRAWLKSIGLNLTEVGIEETALRKLFIDELSPSALFTSTEASAERIAEQQSLQSRIRSQGVGVIRCHKDRITIAIYRQNILYLSRHIFNPRGESIVKEPEQFLLEIQRTIDYYERQMGKVPPAKIIMCVNNAISHEFVKVVDNKITVPVTAVETYMGMDIEGDVMAMSSSFDSYFWVGIYGVLSRFFNTCKLEASSVKI